MLMATSVPVTKAEEEPRVIEGKNFRARRNLRIFSNNLFSRLRNKVKDVVMDSGAVGVPISR